METTQTHSRAKLALGVLTSPSAAFEEILRRKLLVSGMWIAFVTGCLATAGAIIRAYPAGPAHFFTLGYLNPITWVGLLMLYALALTYLLKWLGTDSKYDEVLTIMAWSQGALLLSEVFSVALSLISYAGGPLRPIAPYFGPMASLLQVAYVYAIGMGIRTACGATTARGILSYMIVHLAAFIGFTWTYGSSKMNAFAGAPMGIQLAAQAIVLDITGPPPYTTDTMPWLGAGVLGLILGLRQLGKSLGWDARTWKSRAVVAGLVGAAMFVGYNYELWQADYYGKLLSAYRFYQRDKFAEAAVKLEKLVPELPGESFALMLDVGAFYYEAGDDRKSADSYAKLLAMPMPRTIGQRKELDACALVGLGAARYMAGDYTAAISEFEKAKKNWPPFREPWSRLAVTYARLGDYGKAIDAGNHAVKELKSEAPVVYVALVQAYAAKGDVDQARVAYKKLSELDEDLATKIGKNPDAWKSAVTNLTRLNLAFPLEKQLALPPERAQPKKLAGKR